MTDMPSRGVIAFTWLLVILSPVMLFFAFYTDLFQRPIPAWAWALNLTLAAVALFLGILLLTRRSFMDEWLDYAIALRRRLGRRRQATVLAVEIGSTIVFALAYFVLRQPDGSRPVLYDIAVAAYAAVIGSLLLVILALPGIKGVDAIGR